MKKEIIKLKDIIRKHSQTEQIYLIGQVDEENRSTTIFQHEPILVEDGSRYDLLVILDNPVHPVEIQDMLENYCAVVANVTIMVMSLEMLSYLLSKGHPFAVHVIEENCLLYDAKRSVLPSAGSFDEKGWTAVCFRDYSRWLENGVQFVSSAELFLIRKEYSMTAFQLHQAVEQFLMCSIQAICGFRIYYHDLAKTLRFARWFSPKLAQLFPRKTDQEKSLFQLLQDAYHKARYSADYNVSFADIKPIYVEVKKLEELAMSYIGVKSAV